MFISQKSFVGVFFYDKTFINFTLSFRLLIKNVARGRLFPLKQIDFRLNL